MYGNYNPVFKNQVNEKIPWFASWADKTADAWVDVTDYFNPKPGEYKKREEDEKFAYEFNKAKAPLEELKKSPSTPKTNAKAGASVPDLKEEGAKGDQKKKKKDVGSIGGDKPSKVDSEDKPKPEAVAAREKSKSEVATADDKSKSEVVAAQDEGVGEKQDKAKDSGTVTSSVRESSTESSTASETTLQQATKEIDPEPPSPETSKVVDQQEPSKEKGGVIGVSAKKVSETMQVLLPGVEKGEWFEGGGVTLVEPVPLSV